MKEKRIRKLLPISQTFNNKTKGF